MGYLFKTREGKMKLTKYEKSELKRLLHEVCVARDGNKCLRCGSTERLAASHIYPKGRYRKMEFDYDNVKTLCYRCHIHFFHKNPIEAHEWLEENIGKDRLDRLKLRSQYIDKKPTDYKLIKLDLEQQLKEV